MIHPTNNPSRRLIGLAMVAAALLCTGAHAQSPWGDPAAQRKYEQLVIFGDSLSDTGNKYAVRGIVNEPPYDGLNELNVPSDPYLTETGIYFSNGPIWIELVSEALGAFGSHLPVLGEWPNAGNYAWGGAQAIAAIPDGNRHLSEQVAAYLADVNYSASPETLHVMFIGGNDAREALIMLAGGVPFPDVIGRVGATVGSIQQNLQQLVDAGARRFLIMNVPNIGRVPAIADPGAKVIASCFAELMNHGGPLAAPCPPVALPASLDSVTAGLVSQGIEVTTIDTFAFINGVADSAASFGFDNVTDSCVTPNVVPYACTDPNAYLFWDGQHPTQAMHRMLATLVLNQLGY